MVLAKIFTKVMPELGSYGIEVKYCTKDERASSTTHDGFCIEID